MFRRTYGLLLAGVIGAFPSHAQAQVVRSVTVSATVPDIGAVVSVSTLQWSESQGDESTASGTVSTKHNGPYVLQVRLTTAHRDTVLARLPDGSHAALSTGDWTTVATGPGGANLTNSVNYRIRRSDDMGPPPGIRLTYRVVAP